MVLNIADKMTITTFIMGLVTCVWKIAQSVAYKPLAVITLGLILTYADLVITFAISCYGKLRSLKNLAQDSNIQARVYYYACLYGPWIQQMYQDYYLTVVWTSIGLYVLWHLVCEAVVPSFQRIKRRINIEAQNQTLISGAERMVAGSLLDEKAVAPNFQAEVWTNVINDPTLYYRGVAFRSQGNLYTALHVLADCSRVVIKARNGESVEFKPNQFVETGSDVTWTTPTEQQWGKLQMSSGRIMNVSTGTGVWVKIVAMSKGTFGILKDHDAMGMCEYSGSTIKGFSGAPYYIGNCVYGMHVGSDPKNVGYSGSYIAMLVRALKRPVKCPEDSAEYLINQMNKFGMEDFEYEQSPFFGDEFAVSIGGVHHLVDFGTFAKMSQAVKARRKGARRAGYQYEDARVDLDRFLGQRHPQEAAEVPLVPASLAQDAALLPPLRRGELTYESSVIPSVPIADVSLPPPAGPVMGPPPAQFHSGVNHPCQACACHTQTPSSGSYIPESTHVPRSGPSTTTLKPLPRQKQGKGKGKTAKRNERRRTVMEEMTKTLTEAVQLIQQLKQNPGSQRLSEASKLGELISHVQQTETNGLPANSNSH